MYGVPGVLNCASGRLETSISRFTGAPSGSINPKLGRSIGFRCGVSKYEGYAVKWRNLILVLLKIRLAFSLSARPKCCSNSCCEYLMGGTHVLIACMNIVISYFVKVLYYLVNLSLSASVVVDV